MANAANMPEFHPVFGRLEFDEDLNRYSGKIAAGRKRVLIYFEPDKNGDFAKAHRTDEAERHPL
jgi:hypothetical protein